MTSATREEHKLANNFLHPTRKYVLSPALELYYRGRCDGGNDMAMR